MPERLLLLHANLNELVKKHTPDCLIVENIFFGRNVKTAISVSQARGVIMLSAALYDLPVFEYTPSTVKLSLTGSGKTDKKGVQQTVRDMLETKTKKFAFNGKKDKDFDDSADALAIALHHAIKLNTA
jgi:crossover junction endodeoxyribonuclease RuvC